MGQTLSDKDPSCYIPPGDEDLTSTPGARMSTHRPQLLKTDRASVLSTAPTLIVSDSLPGYTSQASLAELPAAVTNIAPTSCRSFIQLSNSGTPAIPNDMLTMASDLK